MTDSFLYDVFLSHNAKDKPRVERLARCLHDAGLRVWYDDWIIKSGDHIYLAVENGLQTTRALILCMSPAALGSGWVDLERSTALFRDPRNVQRRFIPLLLARCDLPATLQGFKYIDYRKHSHASFEALLAACHRTETPRLVEPARTPSSGSFKKKSSTSPEHRELSSKVFVAPEQMSVGKTDPLLLRPSSFDNAPLPKAAPHFGSSPGPPKENSRMHDLTSDQLAELERFWIRQDRYDSIRKAYGFLLIELKLGSFAFCNQVGMPKVTHSQLNWRSLDRLKSPKGAPLRRRVRQLSVLLLACNRLSGSLEKEKLLEPSFANLAQMANDFAIECPNYPSLSQARSVSAAHSSRRVYSLDELRMLEGEINLPSTNNPRRPEFPYLAPRFPATPVIEIKLPDGRPVFIKDESHNPTGSHKDRWAWEQIVEYKRMILAAIQAGTPIALKEMSMISAGSAALALQVLLRELALPNLSVIIDQERAGDRVIRRLTAVGCKVFPYDLDERFLDKEDVLRITKNSDGIDVTSRDILNSFTKRFYDWLVYEILNAAPKHIFVPVGSGDLLANIILVLRDEKTRKRRDPRLQRGTGSLPAIGVYGITTLESRTLLDKLYARFRPTHEELKKLIQISIAEGIILPGSRLVEQISEDGVHAAKKLAEDFNIDTEFSGVAGLALFMQMAEEIPVKEKVLVVNTGRMHIRES